MLDVPASNLTSALISVAAALMLAKVGHGFWTREVASKAFPASRFFAAWWVGAGAYVLLSTGVPNAAAAFGVLDLQLFKTVSRVAMIVLCLALLGLTYHAAYLLTGRTRLVAPLGMFWFAAYVLVTYVQAGRTAVGVDASAWGATLRYERVPSSAEELLVLALLSVPTLLAALSYAYIAARVEDAGSRQRALALSGLLLAWIGGAFLSSLAPRGGVVFATEPLLSLVTAVTMAAAYDRIGGAAKAAPEPAAHERADLSF